MSMSTWVVDIDGTLALRGERGPYDWDRVGEDAVNLPVAEIVTALQNTGHTIIIVSGRMECCRTDTIQWLAHWEIPYSRLYMRTDGDRRKDAIVKEEILNEIQRWMAVEGRPEDLRFIDDRKQCVDMWRSNNFFCAQVAPGNF
jgi:hypothetical protein